METLSFIIGIGVFAFLLVYMIFKFNSKTHVILQLAVSMFIVVLLLLIPKVLIEDQNCDIVIQNETVSGNTTSYNYQEYCTTNENTSAKILYKSIMWFVRFFVTYLFMYMIWAFFLKDKFYLWGWLNKKR